MVLGQRQHDDATVFVWWVLRFWHGLNVGVSTYSYRGYAGLDYRGESYT